MGGHAGSAQTGNPRIVPARLHRAITASVASIIVVGLASAIASVGAAPAPVETREASRSLRTGPPRGENRPDGAASARARQLPRTTSAESSGQAGRRPRAAPAGIPDPMVRGTTPKPVPGVVRFRPRDGWADVSPSVTLSVRFTTAMDHASTERAFSATVIDGKRVVGTVRWAEGDTVLVLDPEAALPRGARVALAVSTDALSAEGVPLSAPSSVTFTVVAAQAPPAKKAAAPVSSSRWRWPLLGPITQSFGQSLTAYGYHEGVDIDGSTGDPVRAARAGQVVVAGRYDDCGGIEVHIDHGDGVATWYRHLSRIDVAVGATVAAGTVIGRVGNTGCSLGSHLHFAVRAGSTFVDPLRYLPTR